MVTIILTPIQLSSSNVDGFEVETMIEILADGFAMRSGEGIPTPNLILGLQ